MNVSQYIVQFLKASGVEQVFELSGGMIIHLIDAIHQDGGLELVNVYHEQSAAFAADAVGRLSGRPGVALGTSGPGAINLLTGVGSSFYDSSPTVFITGQVNRHEQKGNRAIRQLGFQETDIVAMARPVTKWAVQATTPEQVPGLLREAFQVAMDGRPGAVLLDIPMDVFRSQVAAAVEGVQRPAAMPRPSDTAPTQALWAALTQAKKPLILAGGGVRAAGAVAALQALVERTGVPAVHSLLACDCLPHGHPSQAGMIGTYGNRWANLALSECDLLLVLGSRLDIRQTGADTQSFKGDRQIFQVDVEAAEINNRVQGCVPIHMHLAAFLDLAGAQAPASDCSAWRAHIASLRDQWPDTAELPGIQGINPNVMMHAVSHGRPDVTYCVDVGLHQMWAAQSLELTGDSRFLTSGGMGAMGFALPAAIGAALHHRRQRSVVVVAGDAGFQLNLQELQSVAHHRLPVKVVVMNNHCHGMTRQFQDTYFDARHAGTVWGYSSPAFEQIAKAYGLAARRVSQPQDIAEAAAWFWEDPLAPCLLEVEIGLQTNAYPKLAFGRPISEMEPFAKPIEMEAT